MRWLAMLNLAILASPALAANPEVNLNDFMPSVHAWDVANIMTSRIAPHLKLSGGLWFSYRKDSWAIETPLGTTQVMSDQVIAEFYGALPLAGLVSLGVGLPVFLTAGGDQPGVGFGGFTQASGAAFGDLRLSAKLRFWKKRKKGFGLGLAQDLTFPTASGAKYGGEASVTWKSTLILDWGHRGWVVALNVGYLLRKNDYQVIPIIADELNLGVGLQVPLICDRLNLLVSWNTRTPAASPFSSQNAVGSLLLGGLKVRMWKGLHAGLIFGGGLGHLYGIPKGQISLNISWEPKVDYCRRDKDKDGLMDDVDQCPDVPGPRSTGGCPDRDKDGIIDSKDKCPDKKGPRSTGGCPDRDRDGIIDSRDKCPDKRGPLATKGCPDKDKDGIIDKEDKCPDQAGLAKFKGCPDTDGDGLTDSEDYCP